MGNFSKRALSKGIIALLALSVTGASVSADEFPNRPIRIVVPYSAGGPSDTAARLISVPLSKQLGVPIVVENQGGGGGVIATEKYLRDEPDGYTIVVAATGPFAILPAMRPVSYNVDKDFIPIGCAWNSAQVLAVRPSLGVKTVAEFVAYAKAHPGKVTIGSAGIGTMTHLAIEVFKLEAKIDIIHVPFRSTSNSMPQLLGGQIDALFGDGPIIAPQVRAGKITALAVASDDRTAALPDLVTMRQAGFPEVVAESWFGLAVSSKTPPAIVKRLQDATLKAQHDPDYQAKLAQWGVSGGAPGAEAFTKLIRKDEAKWKRVVDAAHLQIKQ